MNGRRICLAVWALPLFSSALLAAPPASDTNTSEPAPLLTLPPTSVPAAIPAGESRRLPAVGAEPVLAPESTAPSDDETEGSSVSCGSTNRGALHRPAELPAEGRGFEIPEPWRSRHLRYGTDELVGLIQRSAAKVQSRFPEATLGVADLSDYDGGAIPRHRSHQSGRDVDLIFYATDETGQRMAPDQYMPWFNRRGRASYARQPSFERNIAERYFDVAANWALIRALVTDEHVEIERLFVSNRIERWLLRHAKESGEPEELVRRAQRVLHQPRNGESHNDHLHVRIACGEDDVWRGRCRASSAPGRRRLRARVRCPNPLRRRPTELASVEDAPDTTTGGGVSATPAAMSGPTSAALAFPSP